MHGNNITVSFLSLLNIYKELKNTIEDFTHPEHGYLAGWAKQGGGAIYHVVDE